MDCRPILQKKKKNCGILKIKKSCSTLPTTHNIYYYSEYSGNKILYSILATHAVERIDLELR